MEKRDLRLYALLTTLLKEPKEGKIPKLFYLAILIDFLGVKPDITHCNICKRPLTNETYFFIDIENGFSVCKECIKEEKRGIIKVDREIGSFLRHPDKRERLSPEQKERLYMILSLYLKSLDNKK